MISFPNAKLNIGLSITGKREDGFHFIESLMIPTTFCDALEFVESKEDNFSISGIKISGSKESNLVVKALNLVREKHDIPPLNIHLHKNIPAGSGLGGGSADGSYMIKMLNEYFKIGMEIKEMENMASLLGSDCSFFIKNSPLIVKGTGEIMEEIDFHLPGEYLIILRPNFSISTKEAYSGIKINHNPPGIRDIISGNISDWKDSVINEFEAKIAKDHPQIEEIKNKLYNSGALYASMSGSGSAVFGVFPKLPVIDESVRSFVIHTEKLTNHPTLSQQLNVP